MAAVEDISFEQGLSKTEMVARHLRQRILSLEFSPGSFIDKTAICLELRVSRQPVTAALSELCREGLVEILPQRGSYVTRLNLDFMKERIMQRAALEGMAALIQTERRNCDLVARLRDIVARQRMAVAAQRFDDYLQLDLEFHRSVTVPVLPDVLIDEIEAGLLCLKRVFAMKTSDFTHLDDVIDDHEAMAGAIASGDAARAAQMFMQHGRTFMVMLDGFSAQHPELFR